MRSAGPSSWSSWCSMDTVCIASNLKILGISVCLSISQPRSSSQILELYSIQFNLTILALPVCTAKPCKIKCSTSPDQTSMKWSKTVCSTINQICVLLLQRNTIWYKQQLEHIQKPSKTTRYTVPSLQSLGRRLLLICLQHGLKVQFLVWPFTIPMWMVKMMYSYEFID